MEFLAETDFVDFFVDKHGPPESTEISTTGMIDHGMINALNKSEELFWGKRRSSKVTILEAEIFSIHSSAYDDSRANNLKKASADLPETLRRRRARVARYPKKIDVF